MSWSCFWRVLRVGFVEEWILRIQVRIIDQVEVVLFGGLIWDCEWVGCLAKFCWGIARCQKIIVTPTVSCRIDLLRNLLKMIVFFSILFPIFCCYFPFCCSSAYISYALSFARLSIRCWNLPHPHPGSYSAFCLSCNFSPTFRTFSSGSDTDSSWKGSS